MKISMKKYSGNIKKINLSIINCFYFMKAMRYLSFVLWPLSELVAFEHGLNCHII